MAAYYTSAMCKPAESLTLDDVQAELRKLAERSGRPLDVLADAALRAAVGHSSPIVTKRFYDHYVRRSFSPRLRAGLGLTAKQAGGRVVSLKRSAR